MPDASPTKWHLAHTSWFFETFLLAPHVAGYAAIDARYGFLFNSYYEALGPRVARAERGLLSRPALAEVHAYRRHVDGAVARWLERRDGDERARAICELGLHHEQQHQELILTDIKHALAASPLRPAYRAAAAPSDRPEGVRAESVRAVGVREPMEMRTFDEGVAWIGHEGPGFAFDNEGPRHRHFLRGFAIADRPVTCGEYLGFMRDRGYERPELWLSDGWHECQRQGWRAPLYWEPRRAASGETSEASDGAWMIFTLGGVRAVDERETLAHVSYYEADAFARWAGLRLPTEQEWERAAGAGQAEVAEVAEAAEGAEGRFGDGGALHPGAAQPTMFGDVWQWTQSPYVAYPGYSAPPGAIGEYNGKFMSNQMVLRGGSCFTPAGHVRGSYRNFFPPAARWQASGLRLARDA